MKRKASTPRASIKKLATSTNPLIHVRDFQQSFVALLKADEQRIQHVDPIFKVPPNIQISDCFVPSAYEIIETAIQNVLREEKLASSDAQKRKST